MKRCKECGKLNENSLLKYCMEHGYLNKSLSSLGTRKAIKKVSSKRIQSAKFSKETKKQILERDINCIICGNPGTDCHHVFYSQQANYGEDRNNVDQGVLLCRLCHGKAHACKKGEGIRQKCIDYLKEYYEQK